MDKYEKSYGFEYLRLQNTILFVGNCNDLYTDDQAYCPQLSAPTQMLISSKTRTQAHQLRPTFPQNLYHQVKTDQNTQYAAPVLDHSLTHPSTSAPTDLLPYSPVYQLTPDVILEESGLYSHRFSND